MKKLFAILFLAACFGASAQMFFPAFTSPASAGTTKSIVNCWQGVNSGEPVLITVNPASGNLLVVFIVSYVGAPASPSDNIDGTTGWIQVTNTVNCGGSGNFIACFYHANIPAGITTVTCGSASGQNMSAVCHELQGCSTSAPFTATESGTNFNSSGATLQPTIILSNGTASSIFLAGDMQDSDGGTVSLNGSGTVGVWNYFNSNSTQLDGNDYQPLMVANISVTTGTSVKQVWTDTSAERFANIIACFH